MRLIRTAIFIGLSLVSGVSAAERIGYDPVCRLLVDESPTRILDRRLQQEPAAPAVMLYRRLKEMTKVHGTKHIPMDDLAALLADSEQIYFHRQIGVWLDELEKGLHTREIGSTALVRALDGAVPEDTIARRLNFWERALASTSIKQRREYLRYALGEMDLSEVRRLVYGYDPLRPSPESLLGKYLRETGAAQVVKRFPVESYDARAWSPQLGKGPETLVIALSDESFSVYEKYFKRLEFLIHVHTPRQDTLRIAHDGISGTYTGMNSAFRAPKEHTLLPHLLLKTSEGQRLAQYIQLMRKADGLQYGTLPWDLFGYCARGGYENCTHWVANIPLGDERVPRYQFPGNVDEYAEGAQGPGPQVKNLQPYPVPQQVDALVQNLIRRIWQVPGHMQLAELLGLEELAASLRAEYTNPGWGAIRFLAHVDRGRMPVVFYQTLNHRNPIDPDFDPMIYAF